MNRSLRTIAIIGSTLLALALLIGLVWANRAYARAHPREKQFLVPWLGAQTFLHYGDSPYSDAAAQRNQIQFYGRPAARGEDPLRLNLPFPHELLYVPFGLIPDYSLARGLWMTFVEAALVFLAVLTLRLTGWKAGRLLLPAVTFFSTFWVFGLYSLGTGSGAALTTLALTGGLLALRSGRDELAGGLFVLPFFAPQIAGVLMLFLLVWVLAQRRGRVLGGFLLTLGLLVIISFVLLPTWFMPFLRGVVAHDLHDPGLSLVGILSAWWPAIGGKFAYGIVIFVAIILLLEWRLVRGMDFRHSLWLMCLTLSATPLLGFPFQLEDYILLFVPLIFSLSILGERWSRGAQQSIGPFLLGVAFVVPWWIALGGGPVGVKTSALFLIPPIFLVLLLYWERWWVIRPPRTWIETIKRGPG